MLLPTLAGPAAAGDWPQFRGPDGQGHSAERDLPLTWSETDNVVWKTPLPGLGWSSPVIRGRQIWVTTAIEEQGSLRAICIDAATGRIARNVEVFHKADLGPINPKNSHASPTPVMDGDRVFVHFGAHGTACLARGEILWRNEELAYDHRHGPAGSPVAWRNLVIVNCDGADQQFVAALDRDTGRVRSGSRSPRQNGLRHTLGGHSRGSGPVDQPRRRAGYRVRSCHGAKIWKVRHGGESVVMRPVVAHDMVFVSSGYGSTALYAIALGQKVRSRSPTARGRCAVACLMIRRP